MLKYCIDIANANYSVKLDGVFDGPIQQQEKEHKLAAQYVTQTAQYMFNQIQNGTSEVE